MAFEEDREQRAKILYPNGVDTRERSSKGKGYDGNLISLEVLARRFETRKEDEAGLEKQRRPLETERSEAGATDEGSVAGEGRASLRHVLRAES